MASTSVASTSIILCIIIVSTTAMTINGPTPSLKEVSNASNLERDILSSIVYWDIDEVTSITDSEKASLKKQILYDLVHDLQEGESKICACPRILMPYVCDSKGELHTNICIYHCSRRLSENAIKPTMIMTETPLSKAKQRCSKYYGRVSP